MGKYDQYKESVFTHEEMQPMIIETDMTDIVERLLLKKTLETVEDVHVLFADAADEIERLREALKQVGLYAWQGDTFKIMDIVRETIIGKEK